MMLKNSILKLTCVSLLVGCATPDSAFYSPTTVANSTQNHSGSTAYGNGASYQASATPEATPDATPYASAEATPMAMPSAEPTAMATAAPHPEATPAPSASTAPDALKPAPVEASQARAGLLTAGNWRDLDHWDFWRDLFQAPSWSSYIDHWNIQTLDKISVQVKNDLKADQVLLLKNTKGDTLSEIRTLVNGEGHFLINLHGLNTDKTGPFVITDNNGTVLKEGVSLTDEIHTLDMETPIAAQNNIDIMVTLDTTGSMGDELEFLKIELKNVLNQIKSQSPQMNLRASTNFYKDSGDEYVVQSNPFTTNFDLINSQLGAQSASGGGDYPEAVVEALDQSIVEHQWQGSAQTRLLFLVLDAPPHETSSNIKRFEGLIQMAQKKGIRIIPVASSGIDKNTEFLMRKLAISTNGEYIFLTGDSGIGSGHIEPTIGAHEVYKLNQLMINTIQKYAGLLT